MRCGFDGERRHCTCFARWEMHMTRNNAADLTFVRRVNTSIILNELRLHSPLSRADLAARTGLARSTVSSIITSLLDDGLVREIELRSEGIGRPGILLELNPDGGYAIGVEIGIDFVSVVMANFKGEFVWRRRARLDRGMEQVAFLQRVETLIHEALDFAIANQYECRGIGVGLPGTVNTNTGELVFSYHLGWQNVAFHEMWQLRFGLPVYAENDAIAAAFGETYYGIARGVQNFIYIYLSGIGLGSGIFVGKKLLRGANGFAGEIAHFTIDYDGPQCVCGKRGCWEMMLGPQAITDHIRSSPGPGDTQRQRWLEADDDLIGFASIAHAAKAGDPTALDALAYVGTVLGTGIANLATLFNPELVVLGGDLCLAEELLVPMVDDYVRANLLPHPSAVLKIASSAHGVNACAKGAITLVFDEILREPSLQT